MYELHVKTYILFLLLIITNLKGFAQDQHAYKHSFPAKSLTIRTNIPTWLFLVPSLGIAYRLSDRVELAADGALSTWVYKRKEKSNYWRVWNVSPQIRTFINADHSTYMGIKYSLGRYNISREQGNYWSSGISIGKQYYAGKNLLIDLGLTLGFMKFSEREKYIQENNTFYRIENKKDNHYWGPTAVSICLARKVN